MLKPGEKKKTKTHLIKAKNESPQQIKTANSSVFSFPLAVNRTPSGVSWNKSYLQSYKHKNMHTQQKPNSAEEISQSRLIAAL